MNRVLVTSVLVAIVCWRVSWADRSGRAPIGWTGREIGDVSQVADDDGGKDAKKNADYQFQKVLDVVSRATNEMEKGRVRERESVYHLNKSRNYQSGEFF